MDKNGKRFNDEDLIEVFKNFNDKQLAQELLNRSQYYTGHVLGGYSLEGRSDPQLDQIIRMGIALANRIKEK